MRNFKRDWNKIDEKMKEEKQKEANYEFHFFLDGKTNYMKILTSSSTDVLYFDPFTKQRQKIDSSSKQIGKLSPEHIPQRKIEVHVYM